MLNKPKMKKQTPSEVNIEPENISYSFNTLFCCEEVRYSYAKIIYLHKIPITTIIVPKFTMHRLLSKLICPRCYELEATSC